MVYIQTDQLQNEIDWDKIMLMQRSAGGHDEQMKGLFKDAKVIGHYNSDEYSGVVATCVELPFNRFVIYNDYYGSCSGCDAWENATDQEVRNMCITLANSAYIFNSLLDVSVFLSSPDNKSYDWNEVALHLREAINDDTDKTQLPKII